MSFDLIDQKFGAKPPEPTPEVCHGCYGGGWECYSLGHNDPHHRECTICYNPEDLPCP